MKIISVEAEHFKVRRIVGDEFSEVLDQLITVRNAIPRLQESGVGFFEAKALLVNRGMTWTRAEECLLMAEKIAKTQLERP